LFNFICSQIGSGRVQVQPAQDISSETLLKDDVGVSEGVVRAEHHEGNKQVVEVVLEEVVEVVHIGVISVGKVLAWQHDQWVVQEFHII